MSENDNGDDRAADQDLPDAPDKDRPGTGTPQGRTPPARHDDAGRTPDETADNLPGDEYSDAGADDAPDVGTERPDSASDSTQG